jgi:outer membrane protein TolC
VGPQREAAQAVLEATRARVREGRLAPIEIDRAAGTLQQQDLRAGAAHRRRRAGAAGAGAAAGHARTAPAGRAGAAGRRPAMPPLADPARVLERRPDVQRARLGVDAALARLPGEPGPRATRP